MQKPVPGTTYLVGGIPGSGKSTVCRLLARRFTRGVYIPWDAIREDWVVSGRVMPWDGDPEEAGRQMMLGSQAAFQVARVYAGAGFTVVVDGPLPPIPEVLPLVIEESSSLSPILLYLHPRLDVVTRRLRERIGRNDIEHHLQGAALGHANMERILREPWPVHFVDNSDLTPEETVEAIVAVTAPHRTSY